MVPPLGLPHAGSHPRQGALPLTARSHMAQDSAPQPWSTWHSGHGHKEPENGTVQWAAPRCSHRGCGTVPPKALALECTSLFLPRIQTLSPATRNTQTVLISLKTIILYPLGVGTPTLIANSLHTFAAASRSQRSGRHLRAKPRCPGAPTSQSLCSHAPCGARVCGCFVILTALSWSEA